MSGAISSARALCVVFLAAVCGVAASAHAAAPTVDYLYPAGGQQGSTVEVTVGVAKGDVKIEPWPVSVWTDSPGFELKAERKNGTFTATIGKEVPPGPHLVRFYNAEGASPPRVFVVSKVREELEKESGTKDSNDDARDAQPAGKLPAVLNGRLEKSGDVDSWAVEPEIGKWIVADLAARRLNSPIDPSMQLLDPDGTVVAFAHDTFGLDPLVAYQVTRPGRYVLQVSGFAHPPSSDVRFAGSKAAVYRLSVTTGPYARFAFPNCVARSVPTLVQLFGWNLGDAAKNGVPVEHEPAEALREIDEVLIESSAVENVLRMPLSDQATQLELEPNDKVEAAQKVDAPVDVAGQISRPGDVDCFVAGAKKGDRLVATVRKVLGSPIDAVLTITDAAGKQIARVNDTANGLETQASWTAPADGKYFVKVEDLARHGGAEYVYRLAITQAGEDFRVKADNHVYTVIPGKSVDVKLTVTRQPGDDSPMEMNVTGLPKGVTATTPTIPPKGNTATITLKADADAAAANQPFRITAANGSTTRRVLFSLGQDQLIDATSSLWLTVPFKAKTK
jgi:hypothetical protein